MCKVYEIGGPGIGMPPLHDTSDDISSVNGVGLSNLFDTDDSDIDDTARDDSIVGLDDHNKSNDIVKPYYLTKSYPKLNLLPTNDKFMVFKQFYDKNSVKAINFSCCYIRSIDDTYSDFLFDMGEREYDTTFRITNNMIFTKKQVNKLYQYLSSNFLEKPFIVKDVTHVKDWKKFSQKYLGNNFNARAERFNGNVIY